MTVRTRTELNTQLRTGGSSDNKIETKFVLDLLDSIPISSEAKVLAAYTVATVPSGQVAGTIIFVSDGASNKKIAIFDGTNWRYADGVVVGA